MPFGVRLAGVHVFGGELRFLILAVAGALNCIASTLTLGKVPTKESKTILMDGPQLT